MKRSGAAKEKILTECRQNSGEMDSNLEPDNFLLSSIARKDTDEKLSGTHHETSLTDMVIKPLIDDGSEDYYGIRNAGSYGLLHKVSKDDF